eukprot:gnl/TRDRNA2_/TRDRNA2_156983_c1_seq1.p1 gnl/TRDRNA2_/TRDRNA2_156983_c1~~gnl/TRDRNA2_/TRDRNA2_156983_c1_seq1.p1  ORF type:complete len:150 (+),score=25.83 gnl/TRDRNA2_/TRDRNA2_156983_c1_seq1:55-450(+)
MTPAPHSRPRSSTPAPPSRDGGSGTESAGQPVVSRPPPRRPEPPRNPFNQSLAAPWPEQLAAAASNGTGGAQPPRNPFDQSLASPWPEQLTAAANGTAAPARLPEASVSEIAPRAVSQVQSGPAKQSFSFY